MNFYKLKFLKGDVFETVRLTLFGDLKAKKSYSYFFERCGAWSIGGVRVSSRGKKGVSLLKFGGPYP